MNKKIYYVYAILDTRKPGKYDYGNVKFEYQPFYIGKGKEKRCYCHLRENNTTKKCHTIKKIIRETQREPIIIKIYENLSEKESLIKEVDLIKRIGRDDLGLGCLTNLTDGGEGLSGVIHSKARNDKISKKLKGVPKTKEHLKKLPQNNKGFKQNLTDKRKSQLKEQMTIYNLTKKEYKSLSEEVKKKISASNKGNKSRTGQKQSEEEKMKKSIALTGIKRSPETKERIKQAAIKRWAKKRNDNDEKIS